jgi:diacylglycerol kinase
VNPIDGKINTVILSFCLLLLLIFCLFVFVLFCFVLVFLFVCFVVVVFFIENMNSTIEMLTKSVSHSKCCKKSNA